jgi:ABC-type dipeptide/oligopeptide/nickel transport system ATPase subunit
MYEQSNPPDYSRFALARNPFTSLSSEGIENVEDIHVSQTIDTRLAEILSEVVDNDSSLAISLVGELGAGKTQRLKGIMSLVEGSNGFVHFQKVDNNDIAQVTQGILNALHPEEEEVAVPPLATGFVAAIKRMFAPAPPSPVSTRPHVTKQTYDPQYVARHLREGLGRHELSALLLDEIENIMTAPESDLIQFFEALRGLISNMPKGCLFAFACTPEFYKQLKDSFPAFTIRLHAELQCEQLSDRKALELIKKRLLRVRTDETYDDLYPFDESAVFLLNKVSNGNPRVLLRMLHSVLSAAARDPVVDLIDERYVTRLVAVPNSLEEYMSKVPPELRSIIDVMIEDFSGGPVTYIQLSKATKEAPTRVYTDLEELTAMGLLRKKKGHYEILEHIKDLLQEEG